MMAKTAFPSSTSSQAYRGAGEPVSRVLSCRRYPIRDRIGRGSHSSRRRIAPCAPATNPGLSERNTPAHCWARDPYAVLLRVGFAMTGTVTGPPVRSCRTLSPLPVRFRRHRRYTLCGTFPAVARGGRYPPPLFRGARTFLETLRSRGCPAPRRKRI